MITDYQKARRIGERAYRRDLAAGRYPYLPALSSMDSGVDQYAEYSLGLLEIPLSMIAGTRTEGRQNAFASNFMPILDDHSEFALKWSKLYDSQIEEGIREPIKAYEFMNRFYVLEGNKRVSVMKYSGAVSIMANVTRILPPKSMLKTSKSVRINYEYMDFFRCTGLFTITFSEEGSYKRLAAIMKQNLTDRWPDGVIESLKAAYGRFSEIYYANSGGRLSITCGDAFLIYLRVFSIGSLLEDSSAELRNRIMRIWNEFLTGEGGENISLSENPDKEAKPSVGTNLTRLILPRSAYSKENPLRVAFIYTKAPEDSSWIYAHELGRNELQSRFGSTVDTIAFPDCNTPHKVLNAFKAAHADGDGLVFTISPALMEESLRAAIHYPKMKIMNCSINLSSNAVRTYYARLYEAKFLMGMLAASLCENHRIGYRADYPIYGTIANINAFSIGAMMVDPRAEIYLTWGSVEADNNWEEEYERLGIRVISAADMIKPVDPTRKYGLYQIKTDGRIMNLAAPMTLWGHYYDQLVQMVLSGTWDEQSGAKKDRALNYWWGMSAGVVDVILSDQIPFTSRKLINFFRDAIIRGRFSPFDGELHSQNGVVKYEDAPRLSNRDIITMDWLSSNVRGSIPAGRSLKKEAQSTVDVVGVEETKQEEA